MPVNYTCISGGKSLKPDDYTYANLNNYWPIYNDMLNNDDIKGKLHYFVKPDLPFFGFDQSLSRPQQLSKQGYLLEVAIEAGVNAVIDLRDNLNEWDGRVGDGDCGSTVSLSQTLFSSCDSDLVHYRVDSSAFADVQGCNSNSRGHEEAVSLLLCCSELF